jgi:para-aminobenzoate synthetase component I
MNKDEQNFVDLKMKMLNWADRFNIFCFLDNNSYNFEEPSFECLLGIGCKQSFSFTNRNNFTDFQSFYDKNPTWLFGHFGYNAAGNAYYKKSETDFGDGFFFEPEIVLKLTNDKIEVVKADLDEANIISEINGTKIPLSQKKIPFHIVSSLSKKKYIEKIKLLQQHIQRGDCYEINFCQQFFAKDATIHPIETYKKLIDLSPAPFGAFYKLNENYCLCASPERFLQKKGSKIISQPIKGTSKRDADAVKDDTNKKYLEESSKEKSENVMVVDLVRNDMSMVCQKGSVKVKELFGIYSFPQVHQMISTIEGELAPDKTFTEAVELCFPMGSMTGAPKKRVMELIEKYEDTQRGLFSGSIGYITPNGDFDFNVVIRSIFYNQIKNELSFFAGSGITYYSVAEREYEECLAKAAAIRKVLEW